ncbi:MAG: hypothetical protein L0229_01315 [Blastocatellia bacterium]|nr:hypothetical protein [Blastocatellia bacterium]
MEWNSIKEWFFSLGEQYNVNPIIFGAIYIGAIPFFTASIAWLVRNYRKGKSIVMPVLSAGFFFVSAYLYLIIAGRNVPLWVYLVLAAMIVFGIFSTIKKVRRQIKEKPNEI